MQHSKLSSQIKDLSTVLAHQDSQRFCISVGFDGFIDEIITVVNKRISASDYQPIDRIDQFGARISRSAGLSTNIELLPNQVKIGGNGPIMTNALCALEQQVSYVGALGYPEIKPIFSDLVTKCHEVISLTEPAHTDALEFNDGKIMLGKMVSLDSITWENLIKSCTQEKLVRFFTQADLVATVNWTMLPYMNELWQHLLEFLLEISPSSKPYFFVDLADPEKRSSDDLRLACQYLQDFTQYYQVVLGMNRKEASEVAQVLGLQLSGDLMQVSLEEITAAVRSALGIDVVVVHANDTAAVADKTQCVAVPGPYTPRPKLTTGAGDNFNAGFCLGLLLKLALPDTIILAQACSGFYVRAGHSPSFQQLLDFLELWSNKIHRQEFA